MQMWMSNYSICNYYRSIISFLFLVLVANYVYLLSSFGLSWSCILPNYFFQTITF